ncbi:TIGR01906 family membrane protein [Tetragenococcus solitarius]|uniref:TIGR01906 family membrane protein n=1 Tax=Tetragenococcus solitarius TaxID=71453 RepID=A0ABN3Y8K8_9ENTE|nr:TIGR01906 family membrane protein [Tetragenococcus solitarius]
MKKTQIWFERLGILCLYLTLISLAVALAINARFIYVADIDYLNILDTVNLSKERLLDNYDQLMAFLNRPWLTELELPDFPMSVGGKAHFYDVKKLFIFDYIVFLLTIIPSITFLNHLRKNKRFWRLIQPFKWGMAVPIVLLSVMAIGFDRFFVTFHELFFTNDDWLFDPMTDPIINVLPEQYFMHCFLFFFILIEVFFLIIILVGKWELKKAKTAK